MRSSTGRSASRWSTCGEADRRLLSHGRFLRHGVPASPAASASHEGLPQCQPVLLEPIHQVEIVCPSEATAKMNALMSGRRGQILGFDTREGWDGWDVVRVQMPESEIGDLIIEVRSATAGVGSFTFKFDHMAELTGRTADQIIAAARRAAAVDGRCNSTRLAAARYRSRATHRLRFAACNAINAGRSIFAAISTGRRDHAARLDGRVVRRGRFHARRSAPAVLHRAERLTPAESKMTLAEVLARDWFELWYQPKIELKTMRLVGAEALVRARHPKRGVLSPGSSCRARARPTCWR